MSATRQLAKQALHRWKVNGLRTSEQERQQIDGSKRRRPRVHKHPQHGSEEQLDHLCRNHEMPTRNVACQTSQWAPNKMSGTAVQQAVIATGTDRSPDSR